jgi:hypothetical protein
MQKVKKWAYKKISSAFWKIGSCDKRRNECLSIAKQKNHIYHINIRQTINLLRLQYA